MLLSRDPCRGYGITATFALVKEEECKEKFFGLKPSSIKASRVSKLPFFLTFFSFLYPTTSFFMLYTHARKKNFFQKMLFDCYGVSLRRILARND